MKYDTSAPYATTCMIFRKDGKVAFLLRQNTDWMNGHYGFPGGKVEHGETGLQAAIRETREETGVDLKPENLKPVLTIHRKASDDNTVWIDIVFEAQNWQGELYNAEPSKHAALEWLDPEDLPDNVIPAGIFCLEQIEAGNHYAEHGWE